MAQPSGDDEQSQQDHEMQNGHCKNRQEIRQEVLELNSKRSQLENEIKENMSILDTQGVGMNGPLVDSEGYPRNDIDIFLIRQARNKVICLQNDLRGLMKQIQDKVSDYFHAGD